MAKDKDKDKGKGKDTVIAGIDVGKRINAGELKRIQEARPDLSRSEIKKKVEKADIDVKSNAQEFLRKQAADVEKKLTIAGVNVGSSFGAKDLDRIMAERPGISITKVEGKVENAGIPIKSNVTGIFAGTSVYKPPKDDKKGDDKKGDDKKGDDKKGDDKGPGVTPFDVSGLVTSIISGLYPSGFSPYGPPTGSGVSGVVPYTTYDVAKETALQKLRESGSTERSKYTDDMKKTVADIEVTGKLDLQKIVNAGYKNIANIERGNEMVRNVTSMFNF